jgi:hypothetical protein
VRFLRATLILSALLLPALSGCRNEDDIKQETVTYEDREPMRLRVAILEHKKFVWFIRIDGPVELVKQHQAAFDAFVRSSRFTKDPEAPLAWTEPKDWKKDPPSRDRYATFRIEAKPKELEIKVSMLPAKGFAMMPNMHRWQKQVNVPLSEAVQDNEAYLTREKVDGIGEIRWVDMTGLGVHTVSKAADAADDDGKDLLHGFQMKQAKVPFKYQVPDGWDQQPPGQFAAVVFEVAEGDKKAEVTLTSAGGNLTSNLNRWRGQIGLPDLGRGEAEPSAVQLKVAGTDATYVDLKNPAGPAQKNRILGVIVPMGQTSWFIKMTGPIDWVGQNKEAFETFVKSFKR